MPVIRVSPQVEKLLRSNGRFGDTHDSVLRRLLGLQPKHGQRPQAGGGKANSPQADKKGKSKQVQGGVQRPSNTAKQPNQPQGGQNRPEAPKPAAASPGGNQGRPAGQTQPQGQQKKMPSKNMQRKSKGPKDGKRNRAATKNARATKGKKQAITSSVHYRHMMLKILLKAPGHKLQVGGFWPKIKKQMKSRLTAQDRARTPENKVRWKSNVTKARKGLVKAGLVRHLKQGPKPEWTLTPQGVKWAKQLRAKAKRTHKGAKR